MSDLQGIMQSLQLGASTRSAAEDEGVQDRSAFVPNAASLVKAAQASAVAKETAKTFGDETEPTSRRAVDRHPERRKEELAAAYEQRIHPNGDGSSYVTFAKLLWKESGREDGSGAAGDDASSETATGLEDQLGTGGDGDHQAAAQDGGDTAIGDAGGGEASGTLAEQETDIASYPPDVQRLLRMAMAESKSVTEQHNLLSYALANIEVDIATYDAQEQNAESLMGRLAAKDDSKSKAKMERTGKLLTAIRADLKAAKSLQSQLVRVLSSMRQRDGRRIDDGYNLAPKAHFVIANMRTGGTDGGVSALELAGNYRDEVLNFKNPSQFFDNFMLRHGTVGFKKYITLILQLLGDDIKSANPSRGTAQLRAIRDGLFFAEMSNQIFESVRDLEHRLDHLLIVRRMEEGTYESCILHIVHATDRLYLFLATGEKNPDFRLEIIFAPRMDHFALLSEIVFDEHVDGIVFYADPADTVAATLRRAIMSRYGINVQRALPAAAPQIPKSTDSRSSSPPQQSSPSSSLS
jgi:hypothetical protein